MIKSLGRLFYIEVMFFKKYFWLLASILVVSLYVNSTSVNFSFQSNFSGDFPPPFSVDDIILLKELMWILVPTLISFFVAVKISSGEVEQFESGYLENIFLGSSGEFYSLALKKLLVSTLIGLVSLWVVQFSFIVQKIYLQNNFLEFNYALLKMSTIYYLSIGVFVLALVRLLALSRISYFYLAKHYRSISILHNLFLAYFLFFHIDFVKDKLLGIMNGYFFENNKFFSLDLEEKSSLVTYIQNNYYIHTETIFVAFIVVLLILFVQTKVSERIEF